jgi:flagellar motor protein MotB
MSKKHHGGAWKVAYADFVTAMMALFMVLWLTSQDQRIKEAVERAFRNPFSSITKESTGIIPSKDTQAIAGKSSNGNFDSASAVGIDHVAPHQPGPVQIAAATGEDGTKARSSWK